MKPKPIDLLRVPSIRLLGVQAPLVMGIVNVTPDSFSDGDEHASTDAAVRHALKLVEDGADILDIGGESTRPGAMPVAADIELQRVVPVIEKLRAGGVKTAISIDTSKAAVAAEALRAGANIVNDVTAATADRDMLDVCARRRATLVLMHMKGSPQSMQKQASYDDVVAEVGAYLHARAKAAIKAGCKPEKIWLDPGFGFGKQPEHNFALVRQLPELARLGYPIVLGVSRKSTLGKLTGRDVNDREPESLAAGLIGALKGAAVLRVHEVGWMKRALTVARAMW